MCKKKAFKLHYIRGLLIDSIWKRFSQHHFHMVCVKVWVHYLYSSEMRRPASQWQWNSCLFFNTFFFLVLNHIINLIFFFSFVSFYYISVEEIWIIWLLLMVIILQLLHVDVVKILVNPKVYARTGFVIGWCNCSCTLVLYFQSWQVQNFWMYLWTHVP